MKKAMSDLVHRIEGYDEDKRFEITSIEQYQDGTFGIVVKENEEEVDG